MSVSLSTRVRTVASTFGLALLSCFGGTAIAVAHGSPEQSAMQTVATPVAK